MSLYGHLPHARRLVHEHPFALALLVLLLVVIPGFVRIEQTQRQSCERANGGRTDQIVLWTYIIKQTAEPPRTKAERDRIAAFEARLHDIFAPRKCPW